MAEGFRTLSGQKPSRKDMEKLHLCSSVVKS
jgi:hypothetical protein